MSLLEIVYFIRILTELQISFPAVFNNAFFYGIREHNAILLQN
jgi:hypothetical protein